MIGASFDFASYIRTRTELANCALNQYTPPADAPPATLHEAMRFSLLGGGKRIRPLLCFAAAEAVGGTAESVVPTASALEMIHTFSLIHDDLPAIDNDDYRRGQLTSHKKYGEAMAILAGDALHTLAFETIAVHQTATNPKVIVETIALLALASGTQGMVGGQVDDIYYERRPVTAEILRGIHARKTSALLNAAILTGAMLCGATDSEQAALRDYGDHVGLAFQIVDDILDVTGDDATLGKPTGSDEKNDKATYPKLFGLEKSTQLAVGAAEAAVSALSSFDNRAEPLRCFARYIVERQM